MTSPDPWDDDRLTAAFRAGARNVEPPPELVAATIDAVRADRRSTGPFWRRSFPIAAAGAIIVSVVGVSLALSWRTGSSPAPTVPSAPTATGSFAFGLPVIDVPGAIAVRDAGEDDRELAVRGWYSPIGSIECPAPAAPTSPIEPNCPDPWVALMAEPESLFTARADSAEGHLPTGDAFQIDFDGLDTSGLPSMPDVGPAMPAQLVVIGHFDDRRSRLCPADVEQACRDRFVVDRIDTVGDETQALSQVVLLDGEPRSTLDEVLSTLAEVAPDPVVLSVVTTDNGNIGAIEPTLETDLTDLPDGSFHLPIRWLIRTLEAGHPRTYVVTDGTDEVWVIDIDGNLIRFGRRTATTPPTEGPWPPPGTSFTVRITKDVEDRPPFEVAVVDRSGRSVSAREASEGDPVIAPPEDGSSAWVEAEPGDPRSLRLGWIGGNCDRRTIVTISSGLIVVDPNVAEPCNVTGFDRSLILTYPEPINVADIVVAYQQARTDSPEVVASPTPSEGPWPPADARIIELTDLGVAGSLVRVVLIDASGRVTSARAATPADGRWDRTSPFRRLEPESASSPYRLDWLGTSCDADIPITVNVDLSEIVVGHGAVDGCDAVPVERSIVVEIHDGVDTTGVEVSYTVPIIDMRWPEPTSDQSPGAS